MCTLWITAAFFLGSFGALGSEAVDLHSHVCSFGGSWPSSRPRPQIDMLKDSDTAAVLTGCMDGCSPATSGDEIAEDRVHALVSGGLLELRHGGYYPSFPVLVGPRRDDLQHLVVSRTRALITPATQVVQELRESVSDDQIVFHLLWSRVLDQAWGELWALHSPATPAPEATLWVIYPEHPYSVGTNYNQLPGSGSIAITWSPRRSEHIRSVMDASFELNHAAWEGRVRETARLDLLQLGFLNANGGFRGFYYHRDDRLDALLRELQHDYAAAVDGLYDYEELADAFHVRSTDLFVVLLHETAYELFRQLDVAGVLSFPPTLRANGDLHGTRALVSLRLVNRPNPEDEAVALLERSGWRNNPEATAKLREVTGADPGNQRAWLYLGFSLYGAGEYAEALRTFRALADRNEGKNGEDALRMHDWAHIWMGHMYDLLGEREKALAEYGSVLSSSSIAQYSQYGIGPIAAGDWARGHIEKPFTRTQKPSRQAE